LVELLDSGKVQKQATAKADCERMFAIEDSLQGNDIADDYGAGAVVLHRVFGRGDEVLAILKDGEKVDIGDVVEAAGGGELQAYTNGVRLAVAVEALDLSATGFAVAARRLVVRIL
jgi:hypothetical protein